MATRREWPESLTSRLAILGSLIGIAALVFRAGQTAERLDRSIASQVRMEAQIDQLLIDVQDHTVQLRMAAIDRDRVEAMVRLTAEALAIRNKWSNKASEDIVRREMIGKKTHVEEALFARAGDILPEAEIGEFV